MDQDAQTENLYDFLYRDSPRITSYYAQIFGGRLTSYQRSDSDKSAGERSGKVDVKLAGMESKSASETSTTSTSVFDPHDVITADVISMLIRDQRLAKDVAAAPHGSLILVNGTVVFIDKSMAHMASFAIDMMLGTAAQQPAEAVMFMGLIKSFLGAVTLPSAFLLKTANDVQVTGTIKDSGMEEPISSYYFKHGTHGLADVFLVGIKEIPSSGFSMPETQLFGAGQKAAQALSEMLFPKEAIRVTPIAMFRKL